MAAVAQPQSHESAAKPRILCSTLRTCLRVCFALFVVVLAYFLFWPVDLHPVAWTPKPDPGFTGIFAPTADLSQLTRIDPPCGMGPEDVAMDGRGNLYVGLLNGELVCLGRSSGPSAWSQFAQPLHRVLGMDFDATCQNLYLCDVDLGLMRVTLPLQKSGLLKAQPLSSASDGVPYKYCNDCDVGPVTGKVYFTDSSTQSGLNDYRADLMEMRGLGRLLVFDPRTRITTTLLKGLQFPNGVAVSPDESFILIAQTASYTITRYWLTGEKAGTSDIFIDNLPGFPDGVLCNGKDRFWVAIVSTRNSLLDACHPHPFLRAPNTMARGLLCVCCVYLFKMQHTNTTSAGRHRNQSWPNHF